MYAVLWRSLENGDEEDAELRDFILQTLDGWFDETPGGMFSVLVRSAPTPTLRKEILRLLAEASQELSVGSLSRALDDPDAAVRQSAAASLDGLGVDALLDAMTDAVLDNDHSVRATAFQTLEDMHGFAAIWDVGERVVGDPDPRIRRRALELITYGGAENAFDHLTRALRDPDPGVSELALALLAEFEDGPA
jgi:DNA-binding transcriptional ArsR family regulator